MSQDKKRHIKDHLPKHIPADSVWDKIDNQLNAGTDESSKSNSEDLIESLPLHAPSENIWNEIDHKLSAEKKRNTLPSYYPKETTWIAIESKIDKREKRYSNRNIIMRWAAILIIALGSVAILKIISNSNNNPKLEYHVEWEESVGADTERIDSEGIAGNELIEQLCLRSKTVCETPEFKNLESELKQLENDRAEIEAQINPFADNGNLERMLVHIEIEHSKLINEMTRKLL